MRITVLGATGANGTQIVTQALAAGYDVTAVVREPARLKVEPTPRLRVVTADVMDPDALLKAVADSDAVLSSLGPRRDERGPTTVVSDGARSAVTAMTRTGLRRLVIVSAHGAFTDAGDGLFMRSVLKPIVQRVLREGFADLHRMEALVRDSGLDWTIMRPPQLTDGPLTGRYRRAVDVNVRGGLKISSADVAHAMLDVTTDPATIGHSIGVAY
jgi:putative NADH-flavin reductase